MANMGKHSSRDPRGFRGGNNYNEHDNRSNYPNDGTRRVSFKNQSNARGSGRQPFKKKRQKAWDNKIKTLSSIFMNDDDDAMSAREVMGRQGDRHYKQKHPSPRGGGSGGRRMLTPSPSLWYRVSIRHGNRYDKEHVMRLLANYIKPTPLVPIGLKQSQEEISFCVDEHITAEDLYNADRRITVSDGFKLSIRVRQTSPMVEMDEVLVAAIKLALNSRFSPATKAIDLTQFHSDPAFMSQNLFCPLSRPNVMTGVIGILSENIRDLLALKIDNNKIISLEHLKVIVDKLPELKVLHLAKNKIRDIRQLDSLKGLQLEELNLDGNPLCSKFQKQDDYVRAVRQRFPRVIRLDEVDLPPPILFDVVEESGKLPSTQMSFMCDTESGSGFAKTFIEQYYQIFDSNDRTPLLQAYHDDAQYSMDCCPSEGNQMGSLLLESRNLMKVSSPDRRLKLLYRNKNAIIEALKLFPHTEHDPSTLAVDLVMFTPEMIQLNICGIFRERKIPGGSSRFSESSSCKFFSRVFIIVPIGSGFCVVNDQLSLFAASGEQIKKSFKTKEVQPQPVMPAVAVPQVAQGELDLATRQQLISSVCLKTNMNVLWSEKCLSETNWNLDQAVYAFYELQKTGSIPPEAFIK